MLFTLTLHTAAMELGWAAWARDFKAAGGGKKGTDAANQKAPSARCFCGHTFEKHTGGRCDEEWACGCSQFQYIPRRLEEGKASRVKAAAAAKEDVKTVELFHFAVDNRVMDRARRRSTRRCATAWASSLRRGARGRS